MLSKALTSQLHAFAAASVAAQPYSAAPALEIAALVERGHAVLAALDEELLKTAEALDVQALPEAPAAMVTKLLTSLAVADDALILCELRGHLGRAVLNLSQAQV